MREHTHNWLNDGQEHYCCNCGAKATQAHHIVPVTLGGKDIITNIAFLCDHCHDLIHGLTRFDGSISHSELIKQGVQKAREQGKNIGRPSITLKDIPKKFIRQYKQLLKNNSKINVTTLAIDNQISRGTVYKYIALLNEA